MKAKWQELAGYLLEEARELGNCWDGNRAFPDNWNLEDKREFVKELYKDWDILEEYDPEYLGEVSYSAMMSLFS